MVRHLKCLLIIFCILLTSIGCGEKTEEEKLLEFVDDIGALAEDKELDLFMDHIDDGFTDSKERDKKKIKELLEKYYKNYRGIIVRILSAKVQVLKLPEAKVELDISLSSGVAKMFRKLASFGGMYYRFNVEFKQTEGAWKITFAQWYPIDKTALLEGSKKKLDD